MIPTDSEHTVWLVRVLGAVMGVLASLIMVAPEGTKNTFYRVWVGVTMGVIFAPKVDDVWFMAWMGGGSMEDTIARAAFSAFISWSVLEMVARLLSNQTWVERVLREVVRLKARGGK